MSTTDTSNTTPTAIELAQAQRKTAKSQDAFGKDAFMKILVEQLKHQAPDSSSDPNAFINQMTQFSILEQQQQQTSSQVKTAAAAYLGSTVTYNKADGTTAQGQVEQVQYGIDEPTLTVAGQNGIKVKDLIDVR